MEANFKRVPRDGHLGQEMESVYIETLIPSYLTAKASRDLILVVIRNSLEWRETRNHFELFVSEVGFNEISLGNAGAAKLRIDVIAGIPLLEFT